MTSTNPDKYTENFWLSFAEITTAGITKSREWCATVSFFEEFKQRIYDLKHESSSLPSDSNSHRKHPYVGQGGVAERDEQLSYISGDSTTPTAGNRNGVDFFENDSYYDGIEYGVSPNYKAKSPQVTSNINRTMKRRESEAELSAIERTFGRSKRSSSYCSGVPDTENVSIDYINGINGINGMNGIGGGYKYDAPVSSSLKTGHVIMAPISNFSNGKEPSNFTVYRIQSPISTVDPKYILKTPPQQLQLQPQGPQFQNQSDDVNSDPLYCFIKREFPGARHEFINEQFQILLSEGVFGLSSLCVAVKNQSQWNELERKLDPKLCDAIIRNFRDSQQQQPQQQQQQQQQQPLSVASGTSPRTMPATPSAFELVDGSAISSPGVDFSAASRTISKYNESVGNEEGASSPPPSIENHHHHHHHQDEDEEDEEDEREKGEGEGEGETVGIRRDLFSDDNSRFLSKDKINSMNMTTDLYSVVGRKRSVSKNYSINGIGMGGFGGNDLGNVAAAATSNNNNNEEDDYDGNSESKSSLSGSRKSFVVIGGDGRSLSSSKKSYDDDDTKSICLDETFL